ncbi:MAG: hypothetical protein FJX46_09040 [Alphaproteobacteria bacterium]|nr:hypothetical protein [Alphaproteobacteria bacterium]
MAKRYRSDILAAIHDTAQGLHAAGAMDNRTMKALDAMCLTPVAKLSPGRIRAIRLREWARPLAAARAAAPIRY